MYNADKDPIVVISNKEIVFLVAIFVFILVQLYPKNILQKIIEDDHSDYTLTMVYLQDLLKHHPDDEKLNLVFLKKKMQVRDYEASIPIAQKLMNSSDESVRDQATLLAFNAYMIKYFQTTDKYEQRNLYKKIRYLFNIIYAKKIYNENAQEWYSNATFVQNDPARYYFLQQLLQQDPSNVTLLRDAYFIAVKLGKENDANRYMDLLVRYDTKNPEEWALAKYNILMSIHHYDEAQRVLEVNADKSPKIKKQLADFYLMRSKYKEASNTYIELSKNAITKQERDMYIKKAIRALQSGNLLHEAAMLAHNYEEKYLSDQSMRQFIIKIYLAAGRLELADKYAKKILRYKGML